MKRTLFILTFILLSISSNAQEIKQHLIIGKWRLEKEHGSDIKNNRCVIEIKSELIETENESGWPDYIFKKDNLFEIYYTKNESYYGKWELKNGTIYIYRLSSVKNEKRFYPLIKRLLKSKLIFKGTDGKYYHKAQKLNIKSFTKDKMELGSSKQYTIWKRVQ